MMRTSRESLFSTSNFELHVPGGFLKISENSIDHILSDQELEQCIALRYLGILGAPNT